MCHFAMVRWCLSFVWSEWKCGEFISHSDNLTRHFASRLCMRVRSLTSVGPFSFVLHFGTGRGTCVSFRAASSVPRSTHIGPNGACWIIQHGGSPVIRTDHRSLNDMTQIHLNFSAASNDAFMFSFTFCWFNNRISYEAIAVFNRMNV